MLAEQAAKNYREVEKAYGAEISGKDVSHNFYFRVFWLMLILFKDNEDDDWDGLSSALDKGKGRETEHEEEYEGEEQLATVTVVENFDPDVLLHGPSKPEHLSISSSKKLDATPTRSMRPTSAEVRKTQSKTATKAKSVKYQSNAARKAERSKQLKRRTEKAERAGGKRARKGGRGKR
jgi:ribosomal RNA-processing protein 17